MPGNEQLASDLADLTCGEVGKLQVRHFPDGESYVRILSDTSGKDVFIVCTLARPDPQFLSLAFAAQALRDACARRLILIAPYLAYMRQDRIFHPGEALTSRLFAEQLQRHFDELITVDPHLHRHSSLEQVYDIPATVVHAGPLMAAWIANEVDAPLVIGPDLESSQWVESIAREAGAPWRVFEKVRRGDRKVRMRAPDLHGFFGRTAVIVDDILSSGATMLGAIEILREQQFRAPYCLAVHALCSARTALHLEDNSLGLLTSNTVPNSHSKFDVAPAIAAVLATAAAANVL